MRTSPPRPVALNDLLRQATALQSELAASVNRVLASGWYILGRECAAFEAEFAAYCGVSHCISVANGTDALEIALRSLGIGPGDSVATVANAGGYSTTAIRAVGAEPVYIDIDEYSMNMSAASSVARLTPAVRAVIANRILRAYGGPAGAAHGYRPCGGAAGGRLRAGARRGDRRAGRRGVGARWRASVSTPQKTWARWATAARSRPRMKTWRKREIAAPVRVERQVSVRRIWPEQPPGRDAGRGPAGETAAPGRWNARRREIAAIYSAALAGQRWISAGFRRSLRGSSLRDPKSGARSGSRRSRAVRYRD